jgi:hypothetical protein
MQEVRRQPNEVSSGSNGAVRRHPMQPVNPAGKASYNRPDKFGIFVPTGKLRPLHQEQIRYKMNHPAGQRYLIHIGDTVDPDDFCAKQFTQQTHQATDRRSCAYHHVRPFFKRNPYAPDQNHKYSHRMLPVAFPDDIDAPVFSEPVSNHLRCRNTERVVPTPTFRQFN